MTTGRRRPDAADEDIATIFVQLTSMHEKLNQVAVQVAKHETTGLAIAADVRRIATALEIHQVAHVALAEKSAAGAVGMEHRLTDLESAVRFRSGLGAAGVVVAWVLGALGISSIKT